MRKILILLTAFVCGPALAQTTMNSNDKAPGITLSGGNLNVADTDGKIYCIAVDFGAKRAWAFNFHTQNWAGSANSGDPSSNTSGYDLSAHGTSTLYPAVGGFNTSNLSFRLDGNAAECLAHAGNLSGFTSWNTAAGGTLVWDSAKKNAGIALSESDARATWSGGSGEGTVMGTTGIALGGSAKAVFQLIHVACPTACSFYAGVSLSTFSTADRCGENSSANSSCYYYQGPWYRNGSSSGGTAARFDTTAYERFVRSTTSISSSVKRCYEATFTTVSSQTTVNTAVGMGLALSTADFTNNTTTLNRSFPGGDANAWGASALGIVYNNATSTGVDMGALVAGQTYMVCADLAADKAWWLDPVTGLWNGTVGQTPTDSGTGLSIAGRSGGALYAAISVGTFDAGSSITVNFGATAFSNAIPSGFLAWDPPAAKSRGYIFGANDNFPGWVDVGNRCAWAA